MLSVGVCIVMARPRLLLADIGEALAGVWTTIFVASPNALAFNEIEIFC